MRVFSVCAAFVALAAGCGDDGQDLGVANDLAAGGDDMASSADLSPAAHWQQLFPANDPTGPQPRSLFATTWDGDRLLLSGGTVTGGGDLNDLWAFDPSSRMWTQITPNGTTSAAPARDGHGIVWIGSRMVLWGGRSPSNLNDTWTWDATNGWVQQNPSNPPPGTPLFGMTWNGRYVLVYGGGGNGNAPTATVYGYDPVANAWSIVVPASATPSPGARIDCALASSGSGSVENPDAGAGPGAPVLLFGGSTEVQGENDTWSMVPGVGWTLEIFEGATGSPANRANNLLAWDGTRYLMLGGDDINQAHYNDVWAYAPTSKHWTQLSPNGAPGAPPASKFGASFNGAWTGTQFLVVFNDSSVWSFTP